MIPRAYTSVAPVARSNRHCSGAAYSAVIANFLVSGEVVCSAYLAMPKSARCQAPRHQSTFSGFRSRCTRCRPSPTSPLAISRRIGTASVGASAPVMRGYLLGRIGNGWGLKPPRSRPAFASQLPMTATWSRARDETLLAQTWCSNWITAEPQPRRSDQANPFRQPKPYLGRRWTKTGATCRTIHHPFSDIQAEGCLLAPLRIMVPPGD